MLHNQDVNWLLKKEAHLSHYEISKIKSAAASFLWVRVIETLYYIYGIIVAQFHILTD